MSEPHLFVEDDVMARKYEERKRKAFLAKQRAYERHQARQKTTQSYRTREFLNEIRMSNRSGSHVNCLRLFKNNTIAHEQTKFLVCWTLLKWGHDFVTEAIFNNGKRADVIDITEGIVYEVIKSETEEKLADKTENYPAIFEIRKVNANEPFDEDMLR